MDLNPTIRKLAGHILRKKAQLGEKKKTIRKLARQFLKEQAHLGEKTKAIRILARQILKEKAQLGRTKKAIRELARQTLEQKARLRRKKKANAQRAADLDKREKELVRREKELSDQRTRMKQWEANIARDGKEFDGKSLDASSTPENKPEPIENDILSLPDKTLLEMPLPIVNPFLFEKEKAFVDAQIKRGRVDKSKEVKVKYLMQTEPTPLQAAGEAGLFDTNVEKPSDVANARSTAAILYARYHVVDESTVARLLVPSRLRSQANATQSVMAQINRDCDRYQTKIMAFYAAGVAATVKSLGGMDLWTKVSLTARMMVFGKLFDAAPLDIAMAALGPVAVDVPIQDIFSDTSEAHKKWQSFHRTVFLFACEDTFKYRIASNRRMECFRSWRAMIAGRSFDSLVLGDKLDIPVKWGSQSSRKRQALRIETDSS